jgi:membrane associated rhomboid family serine protease
MFPLRDDNPAVLTPFVTVGIIAVNALAWIFIQGMGSEPALVRSVCSLGFIPGEVLQRIPPGTRVQLGPDVSCVVGGGASWHTALTSMFLHGGWFHLIGNMWFLWVFGNNIEDSMGHLRFVVFYVLSGLAAVAAQTLADPGSAIPMVGASGAISGVMGAYIVLYPTIRVHMLVFLGFFITRIVIPAWVMLGYWFLLQVLGGSVGQIGEEGGGVAFWAHAGGFIAGAILIWVFRNRQLVAQRDRHEVWHGFKV